MVGGHSTENEGEGGRVPPLPIPLWPVKVWMEEQLFTARAPRPDFLRRCHLSPTSFFTVAEGEREGGEIGRPAAELGDVNLRRGEDAAGDDYTRITLSLSLFVEHLFIFVDSKCVSVPNPGPFLHFRVG